MALRDIVKQAEKFTLDNSPSICTAIGVVGTVATAYLTGKATVQAVRILERERLELDNIGKVQKVWTCYIPPVSAGVLTIAAIVGANRIGSRRAAAVAAAYAISEKAFTEYKDKVVEKVGAKKEQAVRDEIAQDRIDRQPVGKQEVIVTGAGDVLCCDAMSGRYFRSSVETLRKAMNDTNYQILSDNYASLTDFYSRIGLAQTTLSDEVGWNVDRLMELQFSTAMAEHDQPCIYMDYAIVPIRDYYRVH